MVIDFHTHIFPDHIAEKTIEKLSGVSGLAPYTDGTLDGLKRSMTASGVDCSVVLPVATKPSQAASINAYAARITGRDGIISFGSIHPLSESWKSELDEVAALGLKGIKLHPEYQRFFIDDERVYPVIVYAKSLGLTVVFHSGVDIGLPEEVHCTPERARRMIGAVGGGKLVFAHGGGYLCWDDALRCLAGQNVYLDISFTVGRLSDDKFLQLVRAHSADKILFGSDIPWGSQRIDLEAIDRIGLTEEERSRILYKNAAALLGIGGEV